MSRVAGTVATRRLHSGALADALRERLLEGEDVVLWEDGGAHVLVRGEGLEAEVHEQGILVSLPLEADEAQGTVSVALAFASGDERPDLVAAAEQRPRGEPVLAARWGELLQDAIFAALVALLEDAAQDAGARPVGLRIRDGALELALAEPAEP